MQNTDGFYNYTFEEQLKRYQENHPIPSFTKVLDFSNDLKTVIDDYKEVKNAISFIYHLVMRLNTDEIDINSLSYHFRFKDHELKKIVENAINQIVELKRKCYDKP